MLKSLLLENIEKLLESHGKTPTFLFKRVGLTEQDYLKAKENINTIDIETLHRMAEIIAKDKAYKLYSKNFTPPDNTHKDILSSIKNKDSETEELLENLNDIINASVIVNTALEVNNSNTPTLDYATCLVMNKPLTSLVSKLMDEGRLFLFFSESKEIRSIITYRNGKLFLYINTRLPFENIAEHLVGLIELCIRNASSVSENANRTVVNYKSSSLFATSLLKREPDIKLDIPLIANLETGLVKVKAERLLREADIEGCETYMSRCLSR